MRLVPAVMPQPRKMLDLGGVGQYYLYHKLLPGKRSETTPGEVQGSAYSAEGGETRMCKTKGRRHRTPPLAVSTPPGVLHRVVHIELHRVGSHLEASHLGHLQLDIGVDHVVGEHAALLQELAVLVEILECFTQAPANRRDLLQLRRRQVVEVLVHRVAWMDLVHDAVESRHKHGGKPKVRVGRRIGEAHLDALCLRARRYR